MNVQHQVMQWLFEVGWLTKVSIYEAAPDAYAQILSERPIQDGLMKPKSRYDVILRA